MSAISHHLPDGMLQAYAAGSLPHAFSVVVAAHVSMCAECRAAVEAHENVGGALVEASDAVAVSDNLKDDLLAMLDTPFTPEPEYRRAGPYPGPVVEALQGQPPRWKKLGMGVRQHILNADKTGSLRLLHIPPGQAVPDHGHGGLELTMVLQGSFHDETGRFVVGDVEIADEELEHTPVADDGLPCICLAATDAPLKFNAFMPRLLQPLFRI